MADEQNKTVVYCSGPMFAPGELETGQKIAKSFEDAGFATYLPPRDGLEVAKIMGLANAGLPDIGPIKTLTNDVFKAIFALDVFQLVKRCDLLVFNMNGREADDGSISETAMAYGIGKPIVVYKDDPRTEFNGRENPLLTGLSLTFATEKDISKLPARMDGVRNQFTFPTTEVILANLAPTVRAAVDAGEAIWTIVSDMRAKDKDLGDILAFIEALISHLHQAKEVMDFFDTYKLRS